MRQTGAGTGTSNDQLYEPKINQYLCDYMYEEM